MALKTSRDRAAAADMTVWANDYADPDHGDLALLARLLFDPIRVDPDRRAEAKTRMLAAHAETTSRAAESPVAMRPAVSSLRP